MPVSIIGTALVAQAVDGNATLGNASLTYSSGIWTGLMIPLGLAASLFLVGRFLAAPLNRLNLTTLPEYFFRRYDRPTELLVSVLTVICFTVLIAGNLAAVGWIISVACGVSYGTGLLAGTVIIAAYDGGRVVLGYLDRPVPDSRSPRPVCSVRGLGYRHTRLGAAVGQRPARALDC